MKLLIENMKLIKESNICNTFQNLRRIQLEIEKKKILIKIKKIIIRPTMNFNMNVIKLQLLQWNNTNML